MRSADPPNPPKTSLGRVAARYELTQLLASGGMGEVFVARELTTGKRVALKRLLSADDARADALLRAEYHALARLKHPHIIEVFDFGVDRGLPYYTMELLDGADLQELAPLPYREACGYLRDVAVSLALLHAQRLLHRDVSPRNVRRTGSGRCKLIDLGTMVPFGAAPNVAGTRPYVSPEAWAGGVLDQRSDLYSLGALAYWLLSGAPHLDYRSNETHPSSRNLHPLRIGRRVEGIPAALEELVMSLLALDPARRPSTATEVIVRLNAIAELAPDDSLELGHSHLVSSACVGRKPEMARVERLIDGLTQQVGAAVIIEASQGHRQDAAAFRGLAVGADARDHGGARLWRERAGCHGPGAPARREPAPHGPRLSRRAACREPGAAAPHAVVSCR